MKFLISFLWLVIFTRTFLFWLWLWQLKEYHSGRFLAHFETQAFKKIISGFWRGKSPRFTLKTLIILFTGLVLEILWLFFTFDYPDSQFYFFIFLTALLVPLFTSFLVFIFQIPTIILRGLIIKKAKEKRAKFPNLLVVGITGSYGKTSTKEILYDVLSQTYGNKVLKTKEHQNSEIGISQCILNDLKPDHEIFICEMGAYNLGGIKLLCNIARPKIGILTGINEQHMATFGSLENIIKGKYELIESLPADGIAFFNAKNKYCLELFQKTNIKKYLYGENARVFGEENILGAMAVAEELGMTDGEISSAIAKIENKLPGIQRKKGINGLIIFDATYSANPDSVIGHLDYLKTLSGRKIIVMPCLIELGPASSGIHRRIGKKIAEVCDLAIITTKDRFKEIRETAGEKAIFIDNPKAIFEKIKEFSKEGDIVLLESRVLKALIDQLLTTD